MKIGKLLGSMVACICILLLPALANDSKDLESFKSVWKTVKEKHWDLAATGVDWDKVYEKYLPKAEKAGSKQEIRKIINEMIAELGQSHFGLLGGEASSELQALQSDFPSGPAGPGFNLSVVENRVFITKIDGDSDAAAKGLGIGCEILRLNDTSTAMILTKIQEAYENSPQKALYIPRTLNQLFTGMPGNTIKLVYARRADRKEVEIQLAKPKGQTKKIFNLPPVSFRHESKVIGDNIGYISFNIFLFSIADFRDQWLTPLMDTKAMILDLRGNPGGLGFLASGIGGHFVKEKGVKLGVMHNTGGQHLNFLVTPQPLMYDKPLVVLVDEESASTSEILAAGLQDLDRAKVFGVRSAGAALPSFIEELPNGDLFQYAIADYISLKGRHLEGNGVEPDESTPHTLESMHQGKDAALEAAISWLEQRVN